MKLKIHNKLLGKIKILEGSKVTVLALGGMIGAGKTTLSDLIAKRLGGKVLYEQVSNNELLKEYYANKKRYGFDLQIYFLNNRFEAIKKAMLDDGLVILDRSIYEDLLFSQVNVDLGNMAQFEFDIYKRLQQNMLNELDEYAEAYGKTAPDLLIYLDQNFDNTIARIKSRGRDFEQAISDEDYTYFKELQSRYYQWYLDYDKSNKLLLDANSLDYVHNPADADKVIKLIGDAIETTTIKKVG